MRLKPLLVALLLCSSTLLLAQSPGETVFKKNCVMCHGADGKGQTKMGLKLGAADLTSHDIQALSDEALAQTVSNGKGKMPPFGKTLSDDEINQVVRYVRTLRK
ncbi:MAG TPA: cytochrome c [Candidatus Koribacter sp.]|jgi:mono/diheme cytochrome c family protein